MRRPTCAILVLATSLAAQASRPATRGAAPEWLASPPTARLVYARGADLISFTYVHDRPNAESRSLGSRTEPGLRFEDCAFAEENGELVCTYLPPAHESRQPASIARVGTERTCILPLPAGVTMKWEGSYPRPTRPRTGESASCAYRGELEALAEKVTVRAGTYLALRVRIVENVGEAGNERTTIYWLARGIGLVARRGSRGDLELASVERLDAAPDAALFQLMLAACARDPSLQALGPPARSRVMSLDELRWQKGRFVRLDWDGATALFREKDGTVARFDPCSVKDWNALLDADAVRVPDVAERQHEIAYGPGLLLATERGGSPRLPLSTWGPVGRLADSGGELGTVTTANVPFDDPKLGPRRVNALVVFRDGKFADIQARRQ